MSALNDTTLREQNNKLATMEEMQKNIGIQLLTGPVFGEKNHNKKKQQESDRRVGLE